MTPAPRLPRERSRAGVRGCRGPALLVALARLPAISLVRCAPAARAPTSPTRRRSPRSTRPVVRLVEQREECGPGEPYEPIDVDLLFGEPTVALRGPVEPDRPRQDRPERERPRRPLRVPPRLPGRARSTRAATTSDGRGASRRAARRPSTRTSRPSPAIPGKLALQYWFFYVFNDFNNTARGRLGDDPARLRRGRRARGARRDAGRGRLQLRTRAPRAPTGATRSSSSSTGRTRSSTRPPGSHANKFTDGALPRQLGRGGCRLRRHARPAPRAPTGREDDPERPGGGRARSRGSPSRAAGASSRRRSSTARPART